MNKTLKIILSGLFTVIIVYFISFFYEIIRYSHSSDWQTYKQYMWIFKDSVKGDIDTNFSYSYVNQQDIYNNFHYKKDSFNIIIWEFKNTGISKIKNILINQSANLENIEFNSGEVLNKGGDLEITIKYDFSFNYAINLNLDRNSKIEKEISSKNYKGFYGIINKMSLSNENGEHQILFNYREQAEPALLVFYKGHQSIFLILINSTKTLDENIVNILNLE